MQSTVNTNASSALNTQKIINSYDGGVQSLNLQNTKYGVTSYFATSGNLATLTITVPATVTNLENVSTFTLVQALSTVSAGGAASDWASVDNTNGLIIAFEFPNEAAAADSDKYNRFLEALSSKSNVWDCEINYGAAVPAADVGKSQFDTSSMVVNTQQGDVVQGKFNIFMPRCNPAALGGGGTTIKINEITLHKRARGVTVP